MKLREEKRGTQIVLVKNDFEIVLQIKETEIEKETERTYGCRDQDRPLHPPP